MAISVKDILRNAEESLSKKRQWGNWWGGHGSNPAALAQRWNSCPAPPNDYKDENGGQRDETTGIARQPARTAVTAQHSPELERLVEHGFSPEAAKAALQHFDEWLASDEGKAEMAVAEADANAAGDPILHTGDAVRLEGLVKTVEANGQQGVLTAFRSKDGRWRVDLNNGKWHWVRPPFIKPMLLRRIPLLEIGTADNVDQMDAGGSPVQMSKVAAAWAKLEGQQRDFQEKQEAWEICNLEREEVLRKAVDEFDLQQHMFQEKQRSFALAHARCIAELEAARISLAMGARHDVASFTMSEERAQTQASDASTAEGEELLLDSQAEEDGEDGEDDEGEPEADAMWDMDWSRLDTSNNMTSGGPSTHSASIPAVMDVFSA